MRGVARLKLQHTEALALGLKYAPSRSHITPSISCKLLIVPYLPGSRMHGQARALSGRRQVLRVTNHEICFAPGRIVNRAWQNFFGQSDTAETVPRNFLLGNERVTSVLVLTPAMAPWPWSWLWRE